MNGQSSMEFMMILVAVSAFAASVLGAYANFSHAQYSSYNSLLGAAQNNTTATYLSPSSSASAYVEVYAPSVAYLNKSSSVQVAVYASNAVIRYANLSSSSIMYSPSSYSGIAVYGVSILPFNIVPTLLGEENMTVSVDLSYNGSQHYYNKSFQLYSVAQGGSPSFSQSTSQAVFSAALYPHSLAILSSTVQGPALYQLTEWSHCSYTGFFHGELSLQSECGNAKWYFWIFSSSCYYNSGSSTVTYCVYENPTGSSLDLAGTNTSYQYNVTLSLYNSSAGEYLSSQLSSLRHSNPIFGVNGTQVGNVIVGNAIAGYVPSQDYSYYLLNKSSNYTAINQSAYSEYMQAYNNLNYVLNYYNDSGVGGSELSAIQQAVSSYNQQSSALYNSKPASSPCGIVSSSSGLWYSCNALSMEFGNITASFASPPHSNSSYVFDGSNINIRR